MEKNGIKIDQTMLKLITKKTETKLTTMISAINAISDAEINLNSPKQISNLLFEKLKLQK